MTLREHFDEVSRAAEQAAGDEVESGTIDRLCEAYLSAEPAERDSVPEPDGWPQVVLLAYAWHAAEDAVTHGDPARIRKGLAALGIARVAGEPRLAVLWNSAERIGADAAALFAESFPAAAEFARIADKSLEAHAIRPDESEGVLRYRYEDAPLNSGWWRRLFG